MKCDPPTDCTYLLENLFAVLNMCVCVYVRTDTTFFTMTSVMSSCTELKELEEQNLEFSRVE